MASMVHAGRIVQKMGLAKGCTLWVVGSVQEEDCDGLCWQYLLQEGVIRPEVVVLTEPTNLGLYRGHRGRMEMGVAAMILLTQVEDPAATLEALIQEKAARVKV